MSGPKRFAAVAVPVVAALKPDRPVVVTCRACRQPVELTETGACAIHDKTPTTVCPGSLTTAWTTKENR